MGGYGFYFIHPKKSVSSPVPTEFAPAPPGKYRCRCFKKSLGNCKVTITKYYNGQIESKNGHVDLPQNDIEEKYNLYMKLYEEATTKNGSHSEIVRAVKQLPQFEAIAGKFLFSTLESVVRRCRNKSDIKIEPKNWPDFVHSAQIYRQSDRIFLHKLSAADPNDAAIFFGKPEAYESLKNAKQIHVQMIKDLNTNNFTFNLCVLHQIKDTECIPVLFIMYKNGTYEILKSIMLHVIEVVPDMKTNVDTIITDFDEITIKVMRLCFQAAKFRCTWFYFIKENAQSWFDLNLKLDNPQSDILKYAWTLPLALKVDRDNFQFIDVMNCINDLPIINEQKNTSIFKETLRSTWATRHEFILCFTSNIDLSCSIEACEYNLELKLKEKNTMLQTLREIRESVEVTKYRTIILSSHDKSTITHKGRELRKTKILKDYLDNCLTKEAVKKLFFEINRLKNSSSTSLATASVHDLEDPRQATPNLELTPGYYKSFLTGPDMAEIRSNNVDKSIEAVATGCSDTTSPVFTNDPPSSNETNDYLFNVQDELEEANDITASLYFKNNEHHLYDHKVNVDKTTSFFSKRNSSSTKKENMKGTNFALPVFDSHLPPKDIHTITPFLDNKSLPIHRKEIIKKNDIKFQFSHTISERKCQEITSAKPVPRILSTAILRNKSKKGVLERLKKNAVKFEQNQGTAKPTECIISKNTNNNKENVTSNNYLPVITSKSIIKPKKVHCDGISIQQIQSPRLPLKTRQDNHVLNQHEVRSMIIDDWMEEERKSNTVITNEEMKYIEEIDSW